MLLARDIRVALQAAVAADVQDLQPPLAENAADEPPAVTVRRVLFAAKDGHAPILRQPDQPANPLAELGRCSQPVVADMALLVVELLAGGLPAEGIAEKEVPDPRALQIGLKRFPVELHGVARIGARAEVGHDLDGMPPQQIAERLKGMIGVADREYRHAVVEMSRGQSSGGP